MSLGNPCHHCLHEEELHMPDPLNWAVDLCVGDGRDCQCVKFKPTHDTQANDL
jgi:hypothetical protein